MNQLVSTEWLGKNLEKVKILDASWHLPNANRNSHDEYKACLLYTSPSPRDATLSRMPSSA